jgi:hypothetical protein
LEGQEFQAKVTGTTLFPERLGLLVANLGAEPVGSMIERLATSTRFSARTAGRRDERPKIKAAVNKMVKNFRVALIFTPFNYPPERLEKRDKLK